MLKSSFINPPCKAIALLISLVFLIGCANLKSSLKENNIQDYQSRLHKRSLSQCQAYGLKKGTQEMDNCLRELEIREGSYERADPRSFIDNKAQDHLQAAYTKWQFKRKKP